MKLTIASILPFICAISFCNSLNAFDKGGQLQLIENRGQVTDQHGNVRHDIDLKAEQGGVTLYVGSGELHYQWVAGQSQKSKIKSQNTEDKSHGVNPKSQIPNTMGEYVTSPWERTGEVVIYRMDVELVGANKGAEAVFEAATGYVENYYMPHLKLDGVQAKGYNKVTYKNVYPGIDWVIYTSPNLPLAAGQALRGGAKGFEVAQHVTAPLERPGEVLKYDFIVHEGGNVADIRLRYKGATELKIEDGALIATTPFGSITEAVPYSYEAATGREVNSSYLLQGNELSFNAGNYDGALVIDPALNWVAKINLSSLHSSGLSEVGRRVATDTAGYVYISGITGSATNIATNGTQQVTIGGMFDGYVMKIDPDGARVWGTYYGGTGNDYFHDVITSLQGSVYAVGSTFNSGLATSGTFQPVDSLGEEGLIVGLNATTGIRTWASYYGTNQDEAITTVSCDASGNVYITGFGSGSGVTTALASNGALFSSSMSGGSFIASFTSTGSRRWGTYYPNTLCSYFDMANNVLYVGGEAIATSVVVTTPAHQASFGGVIDGFLSKFSSTGGRIWSTFYGGSGPDWLTGIATDKYGDVYFTGFTNSTNAIATMGGGTARGMLVKFNANGQRIWGVYASGNIGTELLSVVCGQRNDVYVCGTTRSTTGIATSAAQQSVKGFSDDCTLEVYNYNGQKQYGTYWGSTAQENHSKLTMGKGKLYMWTYGTTLPATTGIALNTGNDALSQWLIDTQVYIKDPITDTLNCAGDVLPVPYEVTQNFRTNNVFTIQLSNAAGSFASPVNVGSANTNMGGTINCTLPVNTPGGSGYKLRIIGSAPADTSEVTVHNFRIYPKPANFSASVNNTQLCTADTLKLNSNTTTTGVVYSWTGPGSFSSSAASTTIPNPTLAASGNYYIIVDNNGCKVRDTFTVAIAQSPLNVVATTNTPICTGDTLKLTGSSSTSGVSYSWSGPGNYSGANVTIPNAQLSHGGVYTFKATLGNCSISVTANAAIDQAAFVNIVPLSSTTACAGDTIHFAGFPSHAGTNPVLQWQANGADIPGAQGLVYQSTTLNNGDKIRLKLTPNSTCPGDKYSNEITVTVNPLKAPQVTMSADAGPSLFANEPITFTAVTTDVGNNPEYQWLRNNQPVGGATGATWGANANFLSDGDDICVRVKSSYECASPDFATSNCIKLNIRVSVQNVGELNGVKVYPNPVSSQLTIETPLQLSPKGRGYSVVLYDVVGRVVAVPQANSGSKIFLNMSAVPAGNYVLQVMSDDGSRGYYKIQKGNPK